MKIKQFDIDSLSWWHLKSCAGYLGLFGILPKNILKIRLDEYLDYIKFDDEFIYDEGIESLTEGNYSEALDYFQKSLEQEQNLPECNYYKGLTHQLLSQFEMSIESFNKELSLNNSHINSLIAKGTSLCILSKKEESGLTLIEWKYGFLLEGVRKGKCIVLDNINEIPSQVTERANNLFDMDLILKILYILKFQKILIKKNKK